MNQFGTMLRQERKERQMTLGDLAKQLGISVPYLSQIETGTKPIPDGFVDKIATLLDLIGSDVNDLYRAAALSTADYNIRLREGASDEDRVLASALATGFAKLSHAKKEEIRRIMKDDTRG